MIRNLSHTLLLGLALSTLPAAAHAGPSSTPTFSGPPEFFGAIDINTNQACMRLSLARAGKFTGVLDFAGGTHNVIRGTLNVSGSFSGAASPSQTPYWIAVTGSTPSTYALTGSTAGLALTGFPLAHMKGQTLPDVGTYNAALEITGTGFVPQGFGYAKVHVGKTGASSISGKLPDGTSFTAAGALLADGTIAQLFVVDDRSLYNRKGGLSGYVAFEGPLSTGRLSWQKPPITGPYYPAGFSAQVQEIGYPFSKSTGNLLTTGTISFTGGMLANSGTNAGFTFSNKRYVFNPPNPLNVKLAIDPVTGAMKGSFDFPQMVSGKTVAVKYNGLLLEDGTTPVAAVGYFLSPVISGSGSSGSVEAAP